MTLNSFKLSKQYENLYIECLTKENEDILEKFSKNLICGHVIIFSEEPNILGKYFLKNQYKSEYELVSRVINISLDGDKTEVEFFESKLKNGNIGHIEFDFLLYPKNKIFYIFEEVIEPIVKTGDIGKIMENNTNISKILYFKNLDVILASLSDDKIYNKVINWLEKYNINNNFLLTFYYYNQSIATQIKTHCCQIRIPRIHNKQKEIKGIIEKWLLKYVEITKDIDLYRKPTSFLGFKYYMRYLVDEDYYELFYDFMSDLCISRDKQGVESKQYDLIRDFLIVWLQSGKNHRELLYEITYYVGFIKNKGLKMRLISEISRKSIGIENSKKLMYYLENILSVFI